MYALKNKELTASGQVTTKVTAGTNTLSAPARVLQLSIRCGATLGKVDQTGHLWCFAACRKL